MSKKCLHIIFLLALHFFCFSQNTPLSYAMSTEKIDSLKQRLSLLISDSDRIIAMQNIGFYYERLVVDSSIKYFNAGLDLARQKSYAWGEARLLAGLSGTMEHQGKYAEAFELLFKSLKIAEENNLAYEIARANRRISGVYAELQNYPKSITYLLRALQIDVTSQYPDKVAIDHYGLADSYEKINQLDSANFHINFALRQKDRLLGLMQSVYAIDGHIKRKEKNYEQAFFSYKEGFDEAHKFSDLITSSEICADFSDLFIQLNLKDSAIFYALKGFNYGKEISFQKGIMRNGYLLAELYDSIAPSVALKYFKVASAAENGLFGVNNIQTIQNFLAREEAKQKELDDAKIAYRNRLKLFGLLTGLAVLLIIAFILYRNNRHKQIVNKHLEQQKESLQTALSELKSTQSQLIQSGKMASLGELTAGIAHEIQNPMNFVNNFSEVNMELAHELVGSLEKGRVDEAKGLAGDILSNQAKISEHGRRADSIVKSMLQHSRISSGQKESTDINALADEYLRLVYHGLRAKDKTFNVTLQTDYDNTIGQINIIPQEIGRVLLNLYNNAFYAVAERQKKGEPGYEPKVTVSTNRLLDPVSGTLHASRRVQNPGSIEIRVKDNGMGIPDNVKEKIFQPFFTTKPTGQGTGLGLSLSYDIVTKGHGGELTMTSITGVGTELIILLNP
jgi:signal transduction histidine kinase